MLMDLDNAAAQSGHGSGFKSIAAKVDDWCRRYAETEAMLANDIAHPAKSAVHLWGLQLMPGADMGAATQALAGVTKGIATVRKLGAAVGGPAFGVLDPAKQQEVGKQIENQMWLAKNAVHETIEAVRRANMDLSERDQTVADGLLKADKFVVEQVPEIVGTIVAAITFNKRLGKVVENADKVLQRGATELSHIIQGGKAGGLDKEIGSLQDKAIDAAIDTAAAMISPTEPKGVKAALRMLATSVAKEAMKAGHGKEGPELQKALVAGAAEGFFGAIEEIAKEVPGLKDQTMRQRVMTVLVKAVSGATKAALEDGEAAAGAAEGMLMGAVAVGSETVIHHMSGGDGHAAHAGPADLPPGLRKLRDDWVQSTFSIKIYPAHQGDVR